MRDNKFVLPILIVLLVIFLPAAIYGTIHKISGKTNKPATMHNHKEGNVLYFYDDNNQLVGQYTCVSNDCDDAKNSVDDKNFNYGTGENNYLGVFGSSYALIKDEGVIKLYNLKMQKSIKNFVKMKNYNTKIAGKYIILQNETDHFGLLDLNSIIFAIPFDKQFLFMGVSKTYLNETPEKLRLAVSTSEGNFIVDSSGEKLSEYFSGDIYDYTDQYIILNGYNEDYLIYDYNKTEILSNTLRIMKVDNINNTFIILTEEGNIRIYSGDFNSEPTEYLASNGASKYEIQSDKINILDNNNSIIETYNIEQNVQPTN